jgi:anaerobic selenocysteine-containing dehydrogenase
MVKMAQDRVISVNGDPEHPFTRGVVCGKVALYPQRVYSPDRVKTPLRRSGKKGEGRFRPISWEEALGEIHHRLSQVKDESGPEAILPYSYAGTMGLIHRNAGHAFFHKLGATRLNRTICSAVGQAGFAASLGPMPSTDIETAVDSDLIIIWGSNTISTNLHAWAFFREARLRGARIIVIDPYRNRTARKADLYLPIRPGSDAALALGLMSVLISEGLLDQEFIENHTIGFSELKERVKEYPPERASQLTGVPEALIETLAHEYGKAEAPYIRIGFGPSRQIRGAMAVRTIALLPALVGALMKRAGGLTWSTSTAGHFKMDFLTRPDLSPPNTRTVNMVQLGHALCRLQDPPVKALYVYLSNPGVVAPDSRKVLEGLAREDLFTVVHEQFLTETARFADLVLPGTTFLEHTDLYCCYGHYHIQMSRPVIPPIRECKSPLSVFQDLAALFGFKESCFLSKEEDIIRRILPEDSPVFDGITFNRLAEGRALRLNTPPNPFSNGFATPTGKVEIYSQHLAELGLDPLPDGTVSTDDEGLGRYPLQMITPPRHQFLNSTFNEVKTLRKKSGRPSIMIHPDDARNRSITHGDLSRVFNDRGECLLYADVTADTLPGVTVVEGLYWPQFTPGGLGINQLTSQKLGDLGESCAFHCNLVEVQPA